MTNFPIKPLSDRIVVKRDENPTKAGSLYLPETARQSSQTKTGTVVQVGPGKMTVKGVVPVQLKIGDRIFFGEYAGVEISLGSEGVKFTIMKEEEVIGTLEYVEAGSPVDEAHELLQDLKERPTLTLVKTEMNRSDPT